jgi:adenosylhomocysteine nucleosidase
LVAKPTQAFGSAFYGRKDGPNLILGTIASVDRSIQDIDMLLWLQREFSALATEVEVSAFGYSCHLNGLPNVVNRVLFDSTSQTASTDFEANLRKACQNRFHLMDKMMPITM